ncbi:MAG: YidC/Oxa1 family membrane protein insertase [Acidimicrobiia bacterium]
MLEPFEKFIGFLISRIYEVIPNVGIAIILVTLLVMLLVFPLTHKQTKSMLATQAIQPQIKALQAKYKDDRQKLSEETMKLYKESGVNPLGGCLPLVIQMPFFWAIFRVVRDIEKFAGTDTKLFKALCAPVKTVKLCKADAATLEKAGFSAEKAEQLASKLPINKEFLGLHLTNSLKSIKNPSVSTITAYVILIILLAITSYISMSRQQKMNPNTPSQMKILKYIFPVGISLTGIFFPAGSNLYILTSSTWRACQQEFLYKKIIKPHREKSATTKTEEAEDSDNTYIPGVARQKRKKK